MSDGIATSQDQIRAECNALAEMLIEKNRSYGDSALNPKRVFARGSASDLIRVRIDDKLNRLIHNPDAYGEDVVLDLLGYLILLRIADQREGAVDLGKDVVF